MSSCTKCGACCVAPDISSLGKPLGVRCPHLTEENLCAVYEDRPQICRDYAADWLCERIAAPTLDERVRRYLEVFGLSVRDVQLVQVEPRDVRDVQLVQLEPRDVRDVQLVQLEPRDVRDVQLVQLGRG